MSKTTEIPDMAYIGRVPGCGCVSYLWTTNPCNAASIAKAQKQGVTVELLPLEEAKALVKFCDCGKSKAKEPSCPPRN